MTKQQGKTRVRMDSIDAEIIKSLKKNSRTSFVGIGKKLGITEGAVRQRVGKLTKAGIIKHFTIETTSDVRAIIFVGTSNHIPTSKIAEEIKKLGIDKIYEVSGNFDIICFAEGESLAEINSVVEAIRKLDGVLDTTTTMVLK
jgi:Lrp/AsnC family transcriptional regulator for asnA, asnC and gidA